ncbi:aromatic ring-hydroxylating oxygenase subunit alpha [Roseovarius nanhaiticus]|uniref:aromatic ring-hydroxylating oxygenase subunit alpha n=1 Tax=Roseovarius nanhaiticus TaxID=573024 RepID=UPI0024916BD6|nr:aromatic ring-hydroxylating dioxygenase subunit alpha [Roseovarius nanhaiticus]
MDAQNIQVPAQWDRHGLPAWSFFSEEMLEAEKEQLFRRHWQVVCHVNDVPEPGDFMAADLVGERALVIRGKDMKVRAFHNLCRHRGSRVVAEQSGNCKSAIICPFHGWAYNLDGTLRGAAQPQSLPDLDPVEMGLKPIEMEIWQGFVFVRFKEGPQPSVAEIMARFDDELAQYDLENLVPAPGSFWAEEIKANWKCVRDVDNEGYHVAMAHPGLHDLFGANYHDEPFTDGTSRSLGQFREGKHRLWSVEAYHKVLEAPARLDEDHKAAWLYVGMFPNLVFGFYPDSVIFYHEFPVENGKTIQRGTTYRHCDEDRRMRLARYLSMRIDRITSKEDEQLIEWTWEAAFSSGFDGVVLSDLEYGVKSYHDKLREIFPVLDGDEPPEGMLLRENEKLLSEAAR